MKSINLKLKQMENRNFYTLLLASMLLTLSAQAQDFDISLPKVTVLHQNASGSFNDFLDADATFESLLRDGITIRGFLGLFLRLLAFSEGFVWA